MRNGSPVEWGMRLGIFKDKDAFSSYAGKLDFVVLPAHIVALAPSGVSGFLAGPVKGVPFWVDPFTAVFSLPWESLLADRKTPAKGPRRSLLKLAKAYGEPFVSCLDRQEALDLNTVIRDAEAIGAAAVTFQLNALKTDLEEDAAFFGLDAAGMQPSILISPYFRIAPDNPGLGINANLRLYEAAAKRAAGHPLMPIVVLDPTMLEDRSVVDTIAGSFRSCSASLYGVWVEDLDEDECASFTLANLLRLVELLSADGARVFNLHGGYFSGVLSNWGLRGFSHGPGYGESKGVDPPMGGFPTAKFYVPALHKRVVSGEVQGILAKGIGGLRSVLDLCDCPVCRRAAADGFYTVYAYSKESKKGRAYPTPETLVNCRDHFLHARQREIDFLRAASYAEVREQLVQALAQFPAQMSNHLQQWLAALPKTS